jgi:subtilase family serine protease
MFRRLNPIVFISSFSISIFILGAIGLGIYLFLNPQLPSESDSKDTDAADENSEVLGEDTDIDIDANNQDSANNSDSTEIDKFKETEEQENITTGKINPEDDNTPHQAPDDNDQAAPLPQASKKPDLMISSCKAVVRSDDKVNFTLTVKNKGTASARDFITYLYIDPSPAPPTSPSTYTYKNNHGLFINLLPGQSYTWTVSGISIPSGKHKAYCWADRYNSVDELKETNNITISNFEAIIKPDLIIESFNVNVNNDRTVDVTLVAKNIGNASATKGFYIYYYIDPTNAPPQNPYNYTYYDSVGIFTDLGPGASFTYSKNGIPISSGNHSIYFWADRKNQVDESNENNNIENSTFLVPSELPDLTVTTCYPKINDDATVDITLRIKNIGVVKTRNIYTDFYIDPQPVPPSNPTSYSEHYDNGLFTDLLPGSYYSWTKYNFVLSPGEHTVYCWVDKPKTIQESNENNNIKSTTFTVPSSKAYPAYDLEKSVFFAISQNLI